MNICIKIFSHWDPPLSKILGAQAYSVPSLAHLATAFGNDSQWYVRVSSIYLAQLFCTLLGFLFYCLLPSLFAFHASVCTFCPSVSLWLSLPLLLHSTTKLSFSIASNVPLHEPLSYLFVIFFAVRTTQLFQSVQFIQLIRSFTSELDHDWSDLHLTALISQLFYSLRPYRLKNRGETGLYRILWTC